MERYPSRRRILAGAALAAPAALAAGCTPSGGSTAAGGGAPRSSALGPATLRFAGWWTQQQAAVYEAQVRAFNEQQPAVKVEMEQFSFGVDKILVQIAGGAAPDVYWVNNDQTPTYAAVGGLLDLGPLEARDKRQLGAFLDGSQDQYTYRGKQYVLTDFTGPLFIHYHPELFRKAGIARPAASHKDKGWTSQDLVEVARKLTLVQGGEAKQFGLHIRNASNRFFPVLWAFGGDIFDDPKEPKQLRFNTPGHVAAVEWMAAIRNQYHVMPTLAEDKALGWGQRWEQGTLGMVYEGPWQWPAWAGLDFKWDLLPVAAGPGGRWTRLAGQGYGVWTDGKQHDAAWEWVKFLVSPAGLKLSAYDRAALQGVPVQKAVLDDPQWATFLTPEAKKLLGESAAHGKMSPLHPKWPQMQKAMETELNKAFEGTVSAKEAVAQAHDQMQQVLASG